MTGPCTLVLCLLSLFVIPLSALDHMTQTKTIRMTSINTCYLERYKLHAIEFFVGERGCSVDRYNAFQSPAGDHPSSLAVQSCSHKHQLGCRTEQKQRSEEENNSLFLEDSVPSSRMLWWRCIANNYQHELNEACSTTKDTIALLLIPIIICFMVCDYRTRRGGTSPASKGAKDYRQAKEDMLVYKKLGANKFFCKICMEHKRLEESFKTGNCAHEFCLECIRSHVNIKVQQQNSSTVRCMETGCSAEMKLESCRLILRNEVAERWSMLVSESLILPSQKFYCPFNNCSALLWDDRPASSRHSIRKAECPHCHRLFCAQCRVGWHAGLSCIEFQNRQKWRTGNEDESLMKNLANEKKWQRCPRCRFYVDKATGCLQITCRCGYRFCYRCGSSWIPQHYYCNLKRQFA